VVSCVRARVCMRGHGMSGWVSAVAEGESRAAVHHITARYRKTGSTPGGRAGDAHK
jgi:hypothetical protein